MIDDIDRELASQMMGASPKVMQEARQYLALVAAAAAFSPDSFERELAIRERIEANIDKAIKRLMQIKAMKEMLGHAPGAVRQPQGMNGAMLPANG